MAKATKAGRSKTIESRLQRLDKIVERLGEGKADLNEAKNLYEEGMGLVKDCRTELEGAKGAVEKLNRETGSLETLEQGKDE